MKKLFAIALLTASCAANAGWFFVADTAQGGRLLGKTGSLDIVRNEHGVWVARAAFSFVNDGTAGKPFWVALDAASCATGGGQMALEAPDETIKMIWWASSGTKMYDVMGVTICKSVRETLEKVKKDSGVMKF